MKKKNSHIVLAFLLLANLFFTQVAAGFLHDDHCGRKETVHLDSAGKNSPQLQDFHEECFICSLDLFHDFFAEETNVFSTLLEFESVEIIAAVSKTEATHISSSGRSPPSC